MAQVEIFDGVLFNYVGIDERKSIDFDDSSEDRFLCELEQSKYRTLNWNDSTKFLANFTNNIGGSNFDGSIENLHHFDVYKKIGTKNVLHKVLSTSDASIRVVEDFAVGNNCDYTYSILPVSAIDTDEGVKYETRASMDSNPHKHDSGVVTIMGLIQDNEYPNVYNVDYDEVWCFELNVQNEGTTLNTDKTFSDTQHQYPKMIGGNRKYNTASIVGLIGKINCQNGEYEDDYDMLVEWESFAAQNNLKLLKDKRGRLIPCVIENTSIRYLDVSTSPAEVAFSIRQLEDMDNITILGRGLSFNIAKHTLLCDSSDFVLTDIEDSYLMARRN